MKRVLSLFVVLAMVFAMVPTTYAAGSEIDFDEFFALDDISEVDVSLGEGAGSVTYTWTPETDGILTFAIGELAEGLEVEVVLSQGENSAKLSDSGDGTVTLTVAAGIKMSIVVSEANAAAAEFVMTGTMVIAGTESNPIMLTDTSVELTVPAGKTVYYTGRFSGMIMTFAGEDVVVANNGSTYEPEDGVVSFEVAGGDFFNPPVIIITNNAEEAATYSVSFNYPVGTQMNPEVLEELQWYFGELALEEGDNDGYYYSYTAPADGSVLLYIGSITEGVTGDIVVTNMNTYAQKSLLADGVDNYGLELTVEVAEGDELIIQVMAVPVNWEVPAADISWTGNFTYPEGTEQNPIIPEWEWNEEYTEATATVTVPAGETLYFMGEDGMLVSINGGEPTLMKSTETESALIVITNAGEADAQYLLEIWYPVGTMANPEVLENLGGTIALEESDFFGYYYSYTAQENGSITVKLDSVTDGVEADICLMNNSNYQMLSLSADGVNGELTMEVAAGDVITINIVTLPDANWNYPAADVVWSGSFEAGPIGVPGDMDGNGEVTDADALYLLRFTLFPDRYPITQEGDVNSDGFVTDADALYLLRYTLFPDRYPLYPVAE